MNRHEQQPTELLHAPAPPAEALTSDAGAPLVTGRRTRVRLWLASAATVVVPVVVVATTVVFSASPRAEVVNRAPRPIQHVDLAGAVPWVDEPPHVLPPVNTPATARPRTDAPPCTASDVSATIAEAGDGASGHYQVLVTFRNTGTHTCVLTGYPTYVTATGRGLPSVRALRPSWFPSWGSANMGPGKITLLGLEADTLCAARPTGVGSGPAYHHLSIGLPGGGTVAVNRATGLDLTCGLRVGRFSAPERRPHAVADPLSGLEVSLILPATAVSGRPLTYVVTLTNPTNNPIDLARCPSYVETATAVTAGAADTGTKEAYTLNCAPGVIGAGESVRFEMRVGIPADVGGEFEILWDLGVPRRTPPARGTVSVVGSSR